ncbi:substrate-binding domain-containing protein [Pedobacter sp. JY14-1]|uniref:substrate-binding domain-containing protein n=1 Tax=Pedobacter sp. JY14-1 TaxID=3034151 RepID=UPI0023E0DACE|nr:substrate-binding domain-containing protein [Pedobacter sp. JY14-1]
MRPFHLVCYFFLLCLAAGFSGCGGQGPNAERKTYRIGFSQCVGSDLWRRTMLQEMQMQLSLHPGNELVYADANNSSALQVKQVCAMLEGGIDLLIISPNEAQPLTGIVERAYQQGVPVIVIDRKTASSLYTAYVGAENYQVGRMAGEYLAAQLAGKGNVLEIMGLPASSPAIERARGMDDVFREYPGLRVTARLYGNWLPEDTRRILFTNREKLRDVRAIFAHNDQMAASARQVLRELGLDNGVKVIGVDALPGVGGGLDMISSKVLDASVLYPTGGKEAIGIAINILGRKRFRKENILQTMVIDSSTVQPMKLQWARISSQQKDIERQRAMLADQFRIYEHQRLVLNVIVVTLVLAVVFGGLAFFALLENRKINKSLAQKNEEILIQRNQLIDMSEKAAAATEAKLNFFTNISHEFRTPLTLILSPLEDLLKLAGQGGQKPKALELIRKNVYRLLRLVNELMDYRKIEQKLFRLHVTPNDLLRFLEGVVESFGHHAEKRNIDLRLFGVSGLPAVWFDVNMLDKVFFNLLSNALKFTPDGGYVHLNLSLAPDEVLIRVKDSGVGMTEQELSRIFERFYQSDAQFGRGSGLGLSLSKELMELHHGSIVAESSKVEGTTFILRLPLGESHFQEEEKVALVQHSEKPYDELKVYTAGMEQDSKVETVSLPVYFNVHSVLIVEDNAELLDYLSDKLKAEYEVFCAASGDEGLVLAYEQVPDLIISDVLMPGISGRELAHRLKSDLRTSHIPVILLTAQGSMEQQISGLQSHADLYLTKPFHLEHLKANMQSLLHNRAMLRERYAGHGAVSSSAVLKKTGFSVLDKKFLNDLSDLVELNLDDEDLSVDDIARSIGVSRVQLYRKIKALLNCSVSDYILERRMQRAKYLLDTGEYSVSEVSYQVGVSSPAYFSTIFKGYFGVTPSAYRRNQT